MNGTITFYMHHWKYGFLELESGIILKFQLKDCEGDSVLTWMLSAKKTKINPFIPVTALIDPLSKHQVLEVFSISTTC